MFSKGKFVCFKITTNTYILDMYNFGVIDFCNINFLTKNLPLIKFLDELVGGMTSVSEDLDKKRFCLTMFWSVEDIYNHICKGDNRWTPHHPYHTPSQ